MNRKVLQNDYSAFLALLFYFKSLVNFMTVKLTKLKMNIFHLFSIRAPYFHNLSYNYK